MWAYTKAEQVHVQQCLDRLTLQSSEAIDDFTVNRLEYGIVRYPDGNFGLFGTYKKVQRLLLEVSPISKTLSVSLRAYTSYHQEAIQYILWHLYLHRYVDSYFVPLEVVGASNTTTFVGTHCLYLNKWQQFSAITDSYLVFYRYDPAENPEGNLHFETPTAEEYDKRTWEGQLKIKTHLFRYLFMKSDADAGPCIADTSSITLEDIL